MKHFIAGLLFALAVAFTPALVTAQDDTPTTATLTVFSDIGSFGPVTVPAVVVPVPVPFRPLVVAGSVSADSDSVSISFALDGSDPAPATKVAAILVEAGTVISDPNAIVSGAGSVSGTFVNGTVTVEIPVAEAKFARTFDIVFVGIRTDVVNIP